MTARIVVVMSEELRARVFAEADWARLDRAGELRWMRDVSSADAVRAAVVDARVCVTGWDTPPFPADLFDAPVPLGLVAHTGGSVRWLVPQTAFDRGVRVSQVSAVLAEAVAEFAVMAIIAGLRDAMSFAAAMRAGEPWSTFAARPPGRLLREQTVGIVGASRTGRATLHRLRPFGCRCLVVDPFLTEDDAAGLGAGLASLDRVVAEADVVSLHAPMLPETRGMLSRERIAHLKPGALVVNTARAALADSDALLDAAAAGRIRVVADVFDEEPLPVGSAWRHARGVVATPHIAALTGETLHEQGSATVDEVLRFLDGATLEHEVTRRAYEINA
ncbi:hydroxyacid dehydrogenase [Phytoactinopolyspora halotolerans]|uniref:Hydroxyacid dehydrogenase n=1 Tax=Phytoactinopolyspora halotolerans TaxID=1981512 RepID=A0A6L9SEB5_9ACTN|nr:hydroxyacid dehydrogenase [Phytoactinopolyspora halotolerans]NEE03483.1 hydroxyacid dehydrogenase [Phytoactinopolyspora halotolerans]